MSVVIVGGDAVMVALDDEVVNVFVVVEGMEVVEFPVGAASVIDEAIAAAHIVERRGEYAVIKVDIDFVFSGVK